MNKILSLDPAGRVARVQAGVVNSELTAAARPHGLHYAPDPSSQSTCTLGGNVAENSGGPHCLKYGVTSRWVTGLTLVLPDGRVLDLGGWGSDPNGYDLVGLVVGSEGCFGLVTEIEVRLLPLAEGVRTLLAIFEDLESASTAVTDIIASGLLPCALEIIDAETIRAVEASVFAAGYPTDAGAALVIEVDGTDAGLDAEVEGAEACCRRAGAREIRRAADEAERAALWKGRKKAFGAMGRIAPDSSCRTQPCPAPGCRPCSERSPRSGVRMVSSSRTYSTRATATCTPIFCSTDATPTRSRAWNARRSRSCVLASRREARSPASTESGSTNASTWSWCSLR